MSQVEPIATVFGKINYKHVGILYAQMQYQIGLQFRGVANLKLSYPAQQMENNVLL